MYWKIHEICKLCWKWFPATRGPKKAFLEFTNSQFGLFYRIWIANNIAYLWSANLNKSCRSEQWASSSAVQIDNNDENAFQTMITHNQLIGGFMIYEKNRDGKLVSNIINKFSLNRYCQKSVWGYLYNAVLLIWTPNLNI